MNCMNENKKLSKEDLTALLTKGKLNPEETEDEEFIWRHV